MSKINLHYDDLASATYVPNIFIDQYMTSANGEFVKIYLYLLRCISQPGKSLSISDLADRFEHTEKDIRRALKYWEKVRLLQLEYDEEKHLTGICLLNSKSQNTEESGSEEVAVYQEPTASAAPAPEIPASAEMPVASTPAVPVDAVPETDPRKEYSAEQLRNFQSKDSVKEILFITESYLGRTLNPTEISTIYYWYDGLKLPIDLIEYLIESCVGNGHTSLRYMEKVALSWKDARITTVSEAQKANRMHSQTAFAIMKYFGISGRNLIDSELKYIQKWTQDYAFHNDIIKEACKRTVQATGKASFEYADRILSSWHKSQVHQLSDILRLDDVHQKQKTDSQKNQGTKSANHFNNFPQRNYNYDQLEQQLLKSNK